MPKTDKEKAVAKTERERLAKIEKTRFDALSDADKAKEKAEKLAKSPSLSVVVKDSEGKLVLTLSTKIRSYARALAFVVADNGLTSETTVEAKARIIKFKGL